MPFPSLYVSAYPLRFHVTWKILVIILYLPSKQKIGVPKLLYSISCGESRNIVLHSAVEIYVHVYLHHLRVYYELTRWSAPRWLDSSAGRALHQYRRGHGFKSYQA